MPVGNKRGSRVNNAVYMACVLLAPRFGFEVVQAIFAAFRRRRRPESR
jgi:hypothetical protein